MFPCSIQPKFFATRLFCQTLTPVECGGFGNAAEDAQSHVFFFLFFCFFSATLNHVKREVLNLISLYPQKLFYIGRESPHIIEDETHSMRRRAPDMGWEAHMNGISIDWSLDSCVRPEIVNHPSNPLLREGEVLELLLPVHVKER